MRYIMHYIILNVENIWSFSSLSFFSKNRNAFEAKSFMHIIECTSFTAKFQHYILFKNPLYLSFSSLLKLNCCERCENWRITVVSRQQLKIIRYLIVVCKTASVSLHVCCSLFHCFWLSVFYFFFFHFRKARGFHQKKLHFVSIERNRAHMFSPF